MDNIVLMFAIGFSLIFTAIMCHARLVNIRRCTAQTVGNPDSFKKSISGSETNYYQVYKYVVDDSEYSYEHHVKINKPEDADLNSIIIKYNPNNPKQCYVEGDKVYKMSDKGYLLITFALYAIGIILCLLSLVEGIMGMMK